MSTSRMEDASTRIAPKAQNSSRLVVLSLPSDLDNAGLSTHFSTLDLPMTDVKILRKKDGTSRRMAFIGYSSALDAAKAKDWFDNTWLRGSRIKVDFALPIDNAQLHSRKRGRSPPSQASRVTASGKDAPTSDGIAFTDAVTSDAKTQIEQADHANSELSDAEYLARRKRRLIGNGEVPGASSTPAVRLLLQSTYIMTVKVSLSNDVACQNQDAMALQPAKEEEPQNTRLFLRNLPFDTTESSLRNTFIAYGPIEQIHIPTAGKHSRGLAYVTYARSADALAALKALDGHGFNGRLLHVMMAQQESTPAGVTNQVSRTSTSSTYRQTKAAKLHHDADKEFNWASLYMNSDAVLNSLAKRLEIPKSNILSPESSGAAAKLALAETMLLKETREFFEAHGVRFDTQDSTAVRSSTILLLKNLPSGTNANTIRGLLKPYGTLKHLLIPPSGLVAIVQFEDPQSASSAVKGVAYCKIGNSIIYVERASSQCNISERTSLPERESRSMEPEDPVTDSTSCLFVQNFPRGTESKALQDLFVSHSGFRTMKIVHDTKNKIEYAFVTFESKEAATKACGELDGTLYAGRRLNVALSKQRDSSSDTLETSGSATSKLIIKNLPFEASPADLRTILSPYGKLLSLRIPRKADQTPRGFAFAHFASPAHAQMALENLKHTHLLGRHLIIELATGEVL